MGFLDSLFGSGGNENISTIMLDGAIDQIRRGITTNMRTDGSVIFLLGNNLN